MFQIYLGFGVLVFQRTVLLVKLGAKKAVNTPAFSTHCHQGPWSTQQQAHIFPTHHPSVSILTEVLYVLVKPFCTQHSPSDSCPTLMFNLALVDLFNQVSNIFELLSRKFSTSLWKTHRAKSCNNGKINSLPVSTQSSTGQTTIPGIILCFGWRRCWNGYSFRTWSILSNFNTCNIWNWQLVMFTDVTSEKEFVI